MLAILNSTHFSGSDNYREAAAGLWPRGRWWAPPRLRRSGRGPSSSTRSGGSAGSQSRWPGVKTGFALYSGCTCVLYWPPKSSSRAPWPRRCTWGWAPWVKTGFVYSGCTCVHWPVLAPDVLRPQGEVEAERHKPGQPPTVQPRCQVTLRGLRTVNRVDVSEMRVIGEIDL